MATNLTNRKGWNKITSQSLVNIFQEGFLLLPLAKNIKRLLLRKRLLIIGIFAALLSAAAGCGVFALLAKDVAINDNGKIITFMTMKSTFKEVLEQNGIVVNSFDYTSVPLTDSLDRTQPNEIYIKRAVPVYITADGKQTMLMTYKDTVEEMLKDSPVKPEGKDKLAGADMTDRISEGMKLRIIRVSESIVREKEGIPFEVKKKANTKLDKGLERVVQPGEEGILEKLYRVVKEDGAEVARQFLSQAVLKDPVIMIMEYGTVMNHKTARGDVIRYNKALDVKATAYTASLKDTGKAPGHPLFGITATGIKAKKGVIAVDPKVIPLYTRVYVEILGSTPDYGYAVAADVGGAIKGNKIDLYYDDQEYVDRFGVKKARVYILEESR
jgi:uncharacterized protein YabE (DUF348 family)